MATISITALFVAVKFKAKTEAGYMWCLAVTCKSAQVQCRICSSGVGGALVFQANHIGHFKLHYLSSFARGPGLVLLGL